MGGVRLDSRDGSDLAAFTATVPVPDNPAVGKLAPGLIARGEALFTERCQTCHAGEALTDGKAHPTQSGDVQKLDTPAHCGVFASAPYLDDGSRPTLHSVLVDAAPTIGVHDQRSLAAADLEAFLATR